MMRGELIMCSDNKDVVKKVRQKYLDNPPEGYTKKDIEKMRDDDLLDMDYFLNEEKFDMDF